jgi:hypothetical protein
MRNLTLTNGNIAVIESIRYTFNECIFTFAIVQKDGFWKSHHLENYTIGYYNSVEDYILNNY